MIKTSIKKGSILTEVLVTMVIIVITMVSIVPMFYTGVKASKTSKAKSINTNIIQKEIENLSQQKFSKILLEIEPLITALGVNEFDNFKKDNSDVNKLKDFEVSNTCVYINKTTGDYQNLYPTCDVSKIANLVSKGYAQYQMRYVYSYSKGSNSTDDALQITVELKPFGGDSKPVSMTTILTKDKL